MIEESVTPQGPDRSVTPASQTITGTGELADLFHGTVGTRTLLVLTQRRGERREMRQHDIAHNFHIYAEVLVNQYVAEPTNLRPSDLGCASLISGAR